MEQTYTFPQVIKIICPNLLCKGEKRWHRLAYIKTDNKEPEPVAHYQCTGECQSSIYIDFSTELNR